MKKRVFIYFLLLLFGSYLFACTSFSCYSNEIWYGMNFDFPERELNFNIVTMNDTLDVFRMGFIEGEMLGFIYGYNENGVMSSSQLLYPEATNFPIPGEDEINIHEAWYYITHFYSNVELFEEYLTFGGVNGNGIRVFQAAPITLHNLNVDPAGNAFVLEPGSEENEITHIEDNILVMTNFRNYLFAGLPYTSVSGVGANRYIAAYENILNNFEDFSYAEAWQTLQVSMQSTGGYKTRCSTIFDPATNEIYVALDRDFNHIWRVRLDDGIIETYSGFSIYSSFSLDETGVSSYDLLDLVSSEENEIPANDIQLSNYPNPFNPTTSISFSVFDKNSKIDLSIFNVKGQKIKSLIKDNFPVGEHSIIWNGKDGEEKDVNSGIYFIRLLSGDYAQFKKTILLK
ncbi:MAG: T9SS type A sorting domain-containing protein [Armatimonadetes bacterium]|nr:T9SS type A sorting domain-containing protein [Armatimonadota bacterium]